MIHSLNAYNVSVTYYIIANIKLYILLNEDCIPLKNTYKKFKRFDLLNPEICHKFIKKVQHFNDFIEKVTLAQK